MVKDRQEEFGVSIERHRVPTVWSSLKGRLGTLLFSPNVFWNSQRLPVLSLCSVLQLGDFELCSLRPWRWESKVWE
jgi:hypothetical protein